MPPRHTHGVTSRILLVGAGHAHLEVLRQAAAVPRAGRQYLLVVDRSPSIYSGMLPGFVAGQYRATDLMIDAVRLAQRARAEILLEGVRRVDAARRCVVTTSGREISYDIASLDVGSALLGSELPGVRTHALPVRPIERLVEGVDALVARAKSLAGHTPFQLLVVGAGAGGIELAFCFEARLRAETARPVEVTLLDRGAAILPGAAASLVRRVARAAERRGVRLALGAEVEALAPGVARLGGGQLRAADAVVWSPGPAAHAFLRDSGLPVDSRGYVCVRPTLQVEGIDSLFAVGDCASLAGMKKAGVYAVRSGPVLSENLRRLRAGLDLCDYRPQREFLSLLNLGDGNAIGVKSGISFEGRWVMRLKDRIDRRFVEKYQ